MKRAKSSGVSTAESPMIDRSYVRTFSGDATTTLGTMRWAWREKPDDFDPPVIVGIDPGTNTAAVILHPMGHTIETARDPSAVTIREIMTDARARARTAPLGSLPILVVCERPFVHSGSPNIGSALKIERRVGLILGVAELEGLPVVTVYPRQWQAPLFAMLGATGRIKRDEGKALSQRIARAVLRAGDLTEDEADAACVALWAAGARLVSKGLLEERNA